MESKSLLGEQFRRHLLSEFEDRLKKNPRYSLRAFAKSLKVNDSTLSQILAGKRNITKNRLINLGLAMGMTPDDIKPFVEEDKEASARAKVLPIEEFSLLSEWYYDAILVLIDRQICSADPLEMSKVLGIPALQCRIALERLERVGLISQTNGKLSVCENETLMGFDEEATNQAARNYQKNLMDVSKEAIERVDRKLRNHTSFVVGIDSNLVSEVNDKIRKFQKELVDYIDSKNKEVDEVYAIQFMNFPLTKKEIK